MQGSYLALKSFVLEGFLRVCGKPLTQPYMHQYSTIRSIILRSGYAFQWAMRPGSAHSGSKHQFSH